MNTALFGLWDGKEPTKPRINRPMTYAEFLEDERKDVEKRQARRGYDRLYSKSERGKERTKRYSQGSKGKEAQKRYNQSVKRKRANERYNRSVKRKRVVARSRDKAKLFKMMAENATDEDLKAPRWFASQGDRQTALVL